MSEDIDAQQAKIPGVSDLMADETRLAELWDKAKSTLEPRDENGYPDDKGWDMAIDKMYEFLTRSWPVKDDLGSLERYVNRCLELRSWYRPGNTFFNRFCDHVPPLIARIRELEAEKAVAHKAAHIVCVQIMEELKPDWRSMASGEVFEIRCQPVNISLTQAEVRMLFDVFPMKEGSDEIVS